MATSSFSVSRSSVAERSGVVPMPGVAKLYFLPPAWMSFTMSAIDFTGVDGCATYTFGIAAQLEIGAKLWYGSYGILL